MPLLVYSEGILVGTLDMRQNEPFYGFAYDEGYLAQADAVPLSLSLPLRAGRFDGWKAMPFFEGLLPEGSMRALLARQLGVSETSPAKLLRALGKDCAGDVTILEEDDPFQPPATDRYEPMPEGLASIARNPHQEISRLREGNRLSLAGGMVKIGLYHDGRASLEEGWYLPLAGSPSTHIIKPQTLAEYPLLAYNELICMRLAREAGLNVAESDIVEGEVPLLVVRRFDREAEDARSPDGLRLYRRLRQEDFCQALGFSSGQKYEQDGGPGVADLGELLLRHGADYLDDRDELLRTVAFNYLIGNCDAHAKNFSIMLGRGQSVQLAPAYDLVSTTVYDGTFGAQLSRRLGMAIGAHANIDRVTGSDFVEMGAKLGYRPRVLWAILDDVAMKVNEEVRDVVGAVSKDSSCDLAPLAEKLIQGVESRVVVMARH